MSPTRSYGGSGLGLAISKKLCEAMLGSMWVESPGLGQGCTFSWTVKMQAPQVQLVQRNRRMSAAVVPAQKPQWVRTDFQQGYNRLLMRLSCQFTRIHILQASPLDL